MIRPKKEMKVAIFISHAILIKIDVFIHKQGPIFAQRLTVPRGKI
jgi:hypothetical protein